MKTKELVEQAIGLLNELSDTNPELQAEVENHPDVDCMMGHYNHNELDELEEYRDIAQRVIDQLGTC